MQSLWGSRAIVTALLCLVPVGAGSQPSANRLCEQAWVETRRYGLPPGRSLLFAEETPFRDGGHSYAASVVVTRGRDDANFLLFGVEGPSEARLLFETRFEFSFNPVRERLLPALAGCTLPDLSPYLRVAVLDLDGDGRQEIVLQTNGEGTCEDCQGFVRVFQVNAAEVQQVVEEPYKEMKMAPDEGLTVESWIQGIDGRVIPVEKSFFRQPEE